MNGFASSAEPTSSVSPDRATAGGAVVDVASAASVVGGAVGAAVDAGAGELTGVVDGTAMGCVVRGTVVVAASVEVTAVSSSSPQAARPATAAVTVASQGATRRHADLGRDMGAS
jgi:hypothetical protein